MTEIFLVKSTSGSTLDFCSSKELADLVVKAFSGPEWGKCKAVPIELDLISKKLKDGKSNYIVEVEIGSWKARIKNKNLFPIIGDELDWFWSIGFGKNGGYGITVNLWARYDEEAIEFAVDRAKKYAEESRLAYVPKPKSL